MNKEEINWLKEHLYEIYKYQKSFGQDSRMTYDMSTELLFKVCKAFDYLQQENKQLKDNWNKLKEIAKSQSDLKLICKHGSLWFEVDELLNKMQELEDK